VIRNGKLLCHPDLFLLSPAQMAKVKPFFPFSHGVPRVDDRQVISGIIYVLKHGLLCKDAPTSSWSQSQSQRSSYGGLNES
jgi:transposase